MRADHAERLHASIPVEQRHGIDEELTRILESPDFRGTKRGRLLLRYLVEHTLAGEAERIKERTLGIEIFGLSADYDTGQNSIVRVAANDVRRRLSDHYEGRQATGERDAVRISIPPGSYVPEFHFHSLPTCPIAAGPPAMRRPPPTRLAWATAGVIACLIAICAILAFQNARLRARLPASSLPSIVPWSMLADGSSTIGIVVADSGFGIAKEMLGAPIHLPGYTSHEWGERLLLIHPEASMLVRQPLTSVADVVTAAGIATLLQRSGYSAAVQSSRSFQIQDLKSERPVILLGSANANPWVELLNDHLNFRLEFDALLGREVCLNTSPRKSEAHVFVPTARTGYPGVAYGLIALVPNLSHSAFVLILEGTNMEGTEAAGEFATDISRLTDSLRKRNIDSARKVEQLELLMRVDCMDASPGRSEVIADRVTYR